MRPGKASIASGHLAVSTGFAVQRSILIAQAAISRRPCQTSPLFSVVRRGLDEPAVRAGYRSITSLTNGGKTSISGRTHFW